MMVTVGQVLDCRFKDFHLIYRSMFFSVVVSDMLRIMVELFPSAGSSECKLLST